MVGSYVAFIMGIPRITSFKAANYWFAGVLAKIDVQRLGTLSVFIGNNATSALRDALAFLMNCLKFGLMQAYALQETRPKGSRPFVVQEKLVAIKNKQKTIFGSGAWASIIY